MTEPRWWQRGVIYQVYPRSFQDTNGDGVGDLNGVRQRLDYLEWLGVDAIWLSPIFPSPMADFGYDIADYCGIDPVFGTLADFGRLVEDAHGRGMKLLLDLVPNHTSDQHAWFQESRSSRQSAKRDWYIWRDPAPGGGPPNNWVGNFGGSAWEWDAATGQYYYHAFLKQQPDLNWRNAQVRRAMHDVMRFWLDRGVDGFRVDVIWHLMKDDGFRDNPPNPGYEQGRPEIERFQQLHSADQPEVHEVIAELRRVVDAYPDRVLIGEIYLPLDRLMLYYGADLTGAHLPFNFLLLKAPWNARELGRIIAEYEAALPPGGWPNWVLGNHDQRRIAGRVGEAQARVAAMLLLTLRGTPTIYYGDEIALPNVRIPPEQAQDPWERNEPGLGLGRDPARTPMQWEPGPGAGFTTASPWLPFSDDHHTRNVAMMRDSPGSILALYRRLLALRRRLPVIATGDYRPIEAGEHILAYHRGDDVTVALNLGSEPAALAVPEPGRVLLSTDPGRDGEAVSGTLSLRPAEGVILSR